VRLAGFGATNSADVMVAAPDGILMAEWASFIPDSDAHVTRGFIGDD
jgi:hypothetical protein